MDFTVRQQMATVDKQHLKQAADRMEPAEKALVDDHA
jgi:hypothetical protein